jgi:hypothetical protein
VPLAARAQQPARLPQVAILRSEVAVWEMTDMVKVLEEWEFTN